MKFEIYQSQKNSRWYWRARAVNGEIVGQSAGGAQGGYANDTNCLNAIALFRREAPSAEVIRVAE